MSERRQFMRSKRYHESKRSDFSNWEAMNSKIDEIENNSSDQEIGKYEKRCSKSLTRAKPTFRGSNPELSKQVKRNSDSTGALNDLDLSQEDLKRQVKDLTKKLNKARNEKSKALGDLVKERERSKQFENDARFWREECYKKQDSGTNNPAIGKSHEETVEKLASLFFSQAKIAGDILSKEMKYDNYDINTIKNLGENSIILGENRFKFENLEKVAGR